MQVIGGIVSHHCKAIRKIAAYNGHKHCRRYQLSDFCNKNYMQAVGLHVCDRVYDARNMDRVGRK